MTDKAAKRARESVQDIVDRFIEVLTADESSIAMESRSIIGALVDFKGQIPQSSGFSGFCKLGSKVDRMRDWPDSYKTAVTLMMRLSERKREALVLDRAYRNRYRVAVDPFAPEYRVDIYWDDAMCSEVARCSEEAFRRRVSDGYMHLEHLKGYRMVA